MALTPPFAHDTPDAALAAILAATEAVGGERLPLEDAAGRILAEPIRADRPSPACDVSQMDGYAVRRADLSRDTLPVAGEALIGTSAPDLPVGQALRVFTGSMIPAGAEAVLRREDVTERAGEIGLSEAAKQTTAGRFIRFEGENVAADAVVIPAGEPITSNRAAALASFGAAEVTVHQRVRVSVLVTGDELRDVREQPEPWQIREANSYALRALLAPLPWVELAAVHSVPDEPSAMQAAFARALESSEALLLSGGVSMGQRDFVPRVLADLGCATILHKLPIRPGKPLLAATGPGGKVVFGLPGNPVSVMTTAHRFALPALRKKAGFAQPQEPELRVEVVEDDGARIGLWWYRQVRLVGGGRAELVPTKGSGDLASVAASDGSVEVPPNESPAGPQRYWHWR